MSNIFDIVTARADYEQGAVVIIDQTQLPGREVYLALKTPEEILGGHLFVKGKGCACHWGGCCLRDFRVYAKGE